MTATLIGKYHPDAEINEGVAADAHEGEQANLAAGLDPTPWECECGAAHARGHFQSIGAHRCLRCGYVGPGGRYIDPHEFEEYPTERKHRMTSDPGINLEGSEKPTKIFTAGEWEGQQVQVVSDTWCTGHRLDPVDHFGEPTEYLLCSECLGVAVKPGEFR